MSRVPGLVWKCSKAAALLLAVSAAFMTSAALADPAAPAGDVSSDLEQQRQSGREVGIPELQLPRRTVAQTLEHRRAAPAWQQKVDCSIVDRLEMLQADGILAPGARGGAPRYSTETVLLDADARVRVECKVRNAHLFTDAFFQALGGNLIESAPTYGLLMAWIPAEQLAAFASSPDVLRVYPIDPPMTNIGSRLSEGDAIHRADRVRSLFGFDGTGVTVGAISDGVSSLAMSQASGDLPMTVNVPMACTGSGDEGTAMLEIIYDLVPGANLAFCGVGGGATSFVNAIGKLQAIPVDIITDDLIAGAEPLYENGAVAQAKVNAVAAGIFYTCSAGNRGGQHHHANYNCTASNVSIGGNMYACPHDFNGSGDRLLSVSLAGGGGNSIRLQWAEAFGAAGIDLDLYVLRASDGAVLASSTNVQDGDDDPQEAVSVAVASNTAANILINYKGGGMAPTTFFDVRAFSGVGWNEYNIPAGSLDPVARQPEVHVDGAAPASGPTMLEGFSSRGPALRFFPMMLTTMKPNAVGIDGVMVTGVGGFGSPFFGTSAATPHMAAIAALLLQQNPMLTPAQVSALIDNNAVDIDVVGPDNNAGFGRADALRAISDCSTDSDGPSIANAGSPAIFVDDSCTATVMYSFTVTDNRCVLADDVSAMVSLMNGAATLNAPPAAITQLSATQVSVKGQFTVSAITECPLDVRVNIAATDCCGNAVSGGVAFGIMDSIKPTIVCPPSIKIECCVPATPENTGYPLVSDNCPFSALVTSYTDLIAPGPCPQGSHIERIWRVTDACGNTATCAQQIEIYVHPVQTAYKADLFVWPYIKLRWDDNLTPGNLSDDVIKQDVFISVMNDDTVAHRMKFYFVDGHTWLYQNRTLPLTANQPSYFSAATGRGGQTTLSSFRGLNPTGLPDGANVNMRKLEGFILGFTVDDNNRPIGTNQIAASATVVDTEREAAWEYKPWAFRSCFEGLSMSPGKLCLNGLKGNYQMCPSHLLIDFWAAGTNAFGPSRIPPIVPSTQDFELSFLPMAIDLRALPDHDLDGTPGEPPIPGGPAGDSSPPTTAIEVLAWNEQESQVSNTVRCITCWDCKLASAYGIGGVASPFAQSTLQTAKGKARVRGIRDLRCDQQANSPDSQVLIYQKDSISLPILGVMNKVIQWGPDRTAKANCALTGMGGRADGFVAIDTDDQGPNPTLRAPASDGPPVGQ